MYYVFYSLFYISMTIQHLIYNSSCRPSIFCFSTLDVFIAYCYTTNWFHRFFIIIENQRKRRKAWNCPKLWNSCPWRNMLNIKYWVRVMTAKFIFRETPNSSWQLPTMYLLFVTKEFTLKILGYLIIKRVRHQGDFWGVSFLAEKNEDWPSAKVP